MLNIIVGTSGHVDHGKTCLIKAITGINTDRLKEEQKRGITIELGFAELEHDDDIKIGIIDVPGHEKFIKNMLSGIGGIDLVLLVVAADEGVMPQTREHFAILKLLRIKKGIVVVTKADLVEAEWLEMVKADIQAMVHGSFLEKAPLIEVSAFTGQNIDKLKNLIVQEAKTGLNAKNHKKDFRLPIDRIFTMGGFGTVVTGTLMEGICKVGDEIQLYPSIKTAKIRGLQAHGKTQNEARAGQRTAINLMGVKKEEVERGTVLAAIDSMFCTKAIDVKLELIAESPRTLKNRSKVHVNIGSAEKIAKVILAEGDKLEPGNTGYAQLRFMNDIAVKRGDRFIIRFFSPLDTMGGGEVLDSNPLRHKMKRSEFLNACQQKELDTPQKAMLQMIKDSRYNFMQFSMLIKKMNLDKDELSAMLKLGVEQKKIIQIEADNYIHESIAQGLSEVAKTILADFHKQNPILQGIGREELKSRLVANLHVLDAKKADSMCKYLVQSACIKENSGLFSAHDFVVKYSDEQKLMRTDIEKKFIADAFQMPSIDEISESHKNKKLAKQIVEELATEGILVKVKYPYYIHHTYWNKALSLLQEYKAKKADIVLGEFRDALGISRKYAMLILEGFDDRALTQKIGDVRVCR